MVFDLDTILSTDVTLPALSNRYYELKSLSESDEVTVTKVAQIVKRDQSFASRILRAANSPYYSFSMRIDSIDRAVSLIGWREVMNLALSLDIVEGFSGLRGDIVEKFWRHTVIVATLSKDIAADVSKPDKEAAYAVGLLHDIGFLFLLKFQHAVVNKIMNLVSRKVPIWDAEQDVIGMTHFDISAELMKHWKLPLVFHHAVTLLGDVKKGSMADAVRLADFVRSAHKLAESNGDCLWWDVIPDTDEKNRSKIDYTFSRTRSEGLRAILNI